MKITYENIVDSLINTFPEFTEFNKDNLDIPHVIVGNFAELLVNKIESSQSDPIVIKAFKFINDIFDTSENTKLLDLIQIEVFENLAQSEKSIIYSREHLNDKAKDAFERAMDGFGIKSMRIQK